VVASDAVRVILAALGTVAAFKTPYAVTSAHLRYGVRGTLRTVPPTAFSIRKPDSDLDELGRRWKQELARKQFVKRNRNPITASLAVLAFRAMNAPERWGNRVQSVCDVLARRALNAPRRWSSRGAAVWGAWPFRTFTWAIASPSVEPAIVVPDLPADSDARSSSADMNDLPLPVGWRVFSDATTGLSYYVSPEGVSTWTRPQPPPAYAPPLQVPPPPKEPPPIVGGARPKNKGARDGAPAPQLMTRPKLPLKSASTPMRISAPPPPRFQLATPPTTTPEEPTTTPNLRGPPKARLDTATTFGVRKGPKIAGLSLDVAAAIRRERNPLADPMRAPAAIFYPPQPAPYPPPAAPYPPQPAPYPPPVAPPPLAPPPLAPSASYWASTVSDYNAIQRDRSSRSQGSSGSSGSSDYDAIQRDRSSRSQGSSGSSDYDAIQRDRPSQPAYDMRSQPVARPAASSWAPPVARPAASVASALTDAYRLGDPYPSAMPSAGVTRHQEASWQQPDLRQQRPPASVAARPPASAAARPPPSAAARPMPTAAPRSAPTEAPAVVRAESRGAPATAPADVNSMRAPATAPADVNSMRAPATAPADVNSMRASNAWLPGGWRNRTTSA
jgi:hypothetical protein